MHGKRKPTIVLLILAVFALALAVAACGDDDGDGAAAGGQATTETAAQTLTLTGDETTLALSAGTGRVLEDNDVAVAPVDPATAGDDGIAFPITGGEVDAESLTEREDAADGTIVVRGIGATLTDDAARALNDAFSVELFEGGLPVGDVTVRATAG